MAFAFQKTYSPEIERLLYQYYQSLSEKDRRRFAALEAITLGHGGIRYIAKVLACDPQTMQDGMRELKQLPDAPAGSRVRTRTQQDGSQTSRPPPAGAKHAQGPRRRRPHAPRCGVDGLDPPREFPN